MFKLFLGLGFIFVIASLLSAMMDGESLAASTLRVAVTDSSSLTVLPLTSVDGYLDPNGVGEEVVVVENEVFHYTGTETVTAANCPNPDGGNFGVPCLTGVTRAHNHTDRRSHGVDEVVYNEMLGTINMLSSFDVARNTIDIGFINTPIPSPLAIGQSFVPLVMFDYAYLDNVPLLGIFLKLIGVGFISMMLIVFLQLARGLFA